MALILLLKAGVTKVRSNAPLVGLTLAKRCKLVALPMLVNEPPMIRLVLPWLAIAKMLSPAPANWKVFVATKPLVVI